ncbi:M56 family metallopeptidase, partial [uncultured Muribaculum sp.]
VQLMSPLPQPSIADDYAAQPTTWPRIALIVYLAGIAAVVIHMAIVWLRIARITASGTKIRDGRYIIVLTDDDKVAPFSWHRYIVMSLSDYKQAGVMITAHEKQHIDRQHWIDLLLAQFIVTVNWFNPAAWLVREELKAVHEYEADKRVLDSGINARDYQMLLISKATGMKFPTVANSLNHCKLKKRMTMMMTSQASMSRRLRTLAAIPAVALAVLAINHDAVAAALDHVNNSALFYSDDKESTPDIVIMGHDATDVQTESKHDDTYGISDIKVIGYEAVRKEPAPKPDDSHARDRKPMTSPRIFINGIEKDMEEIMKIDPSSIESIAVTRDDDDRIYVTLKDRANP